ncbi:MAG: hypothetical protein IIA67_11995, partial [Planctomycetes bacterium]|nr:hypothetical protein [Planctomycetota bacterium]
MSQIPFIDPSRLGPAAGGSRSPLSLSPDQGASSFNDHLERAGRPTEQTPRGETHSAAATPQDETPPRRQTQIDGSRSTDRPLASDPQADAGTTEDSVGDSGVTEPASTEADADQPPVEEDEVSGEDDVLQLSGDVAIVESQGSTEAAAIAHDVPVGPDETGTNEEANSANAGSRRRLRGGNAEGSAASGVIKDAADGAADETASDVAGRRAGVAAAGSRAAVRELVTSAEGIEADESKEAQHTTISTTKNRPSGPKLSADASTTRVASNGPVENDAPADTAAEVTSTQSGDRTNGLVDGAAQTSTSKSRRPATNQS